MKIYRCKKCGSWKIKFNNVPARIYGNIECGKPNSSGKDKNHDWGKNRLAMTLIVETICLFGLCAFYIFVEFILSIFKQKKRRCYKCNKSLSDFYAIKFWLDNGKSCHEVCDTCFKMLKTDSDK
jgi:hypothetical protein